MRRMLRHLRGIPKARSGDDLPPREIDLANISLDILRRVFHAGTVHGLIDGRRHVNPEKAEWLQSYLSERLDIEAYHWEFIASWSED